MYFVMVKVIITHLNLSQLLPLYIYSKHHESYPVSLPFYSFNA